MPLSRSMTIRMKRRESERFKMRTKSFQLEDTVPGTFLLQGWFGGILAAIVYVVALCLWDGYISFANAVAAVAYFAILTSVLGVIKAVLMWLPYRLAKVQLRHVTRIVIASLATGLFAVATGYLFGTGRRDDMAAWTLTLLLGGLPTAILIGSTIKPWELFTFGSIAGKKLRSVWGTLGTLPLRFLSILALALWILSLASDRETRTLDVTPSLLVPIAYLLFSAYVTFRSPRKTVLFVVALLLNLPIAGFGIFAFVNYPRAQFAPEMLFGVGAISTAFVVAWSVFLIARLSVRTPPVSMIDFSEALRRANSQRDHDCLGSHFLEWQQRVA